MFDVQVIGHAQLKEELAVGITLANTMSSQDAVPGRPISTNSGIKIAKDDEIVCLRYSVDFFPISLGTRLVLMANPTLAFLLRCGALPDQKNV